MNYFKVSKFFLFVALFCVLIVSSSTLFPFIVGKYVWFRLAAGLAFIFFLLGILFKDDMAPEIAGEHRTVSKRFSAIFREPLVVAVTAFVSVYLLAGVFGYDPGASFWSNFERGEGGFQLLNLYVFFLLLRTLFVKRDDWKKFFITSLSVSGLVILYGLAASFGLNGFIGPTICGRFSGSLGNPAYLAPYLMFIMFFTGWLWFSRESMKNKGRNMLYAFLIFIFFFFFLLTQTRGSFLGLGVGAIVMFLYLAFKLPKGKWKTASGVAGVFLIILGSLAFTFRHSNIPVVPFCPSSSRLLEISTILGWGPENFSVVFDKSAQTRFWTWGSAIKGWKERPILGWGPENFSVVFDKYFDSRHFVPGQNSETWFDRAHSVYFDYLAETGILGLLGYLGIFAVYFWEFFKKRKGRHILEALLFAIPVAYLVQGIALFDVLPIYLNLFITLAFASFYFNEKESKNSKF